MIKKTFKILIVVITCALAAAMAFLHYERKHNPFIWTAMGGDNSVATYPVKVVLGATEFRIPRNYFLMLPEQCGHQFDPECSGFLLKMLLPDFQPRSAENAAELNGVGGWRTQIMANVDYKGNSLTGKALFDAFYKYAKESTVQYGEFQKFQSPGFDDLFKGSPDNPTFFIRCAEERADSSTYCQRTIKIGPYTTMNYTLPRGYLNEAANIEKQLVVKLNNFRISGPMLEVIE